MKRGVLKLTLTNRSLVVHGIRARSFVCVITTCTFLGICIPATGQDHDASAGHLQMQNESEADSRKPLKLLPMMAQHQKENMREHLVAVQKIVAALAVNDFTSVEQAAQTLDYSPQMAAMCNNMGAATPGYSERAIAFHHTADSITESARKKDQVAVMTALGKTLGTCTSCHAVYRQEVVDQKTWDQLSTVPTHH
jgi:hypothetical protein